MLLALFIASLLTSFSPLRAGLEELTILVSADGTQHLILGGDIHDREPGTQTERLATAIAECQKRDPSTFEVYIEKPFRLFDQTPCLLADAYKELRTRKIPGLKVEDCEIRNVAALAYWLLDMEYPHGVCNEVVVHTGVKSCRVGEATIQDLDKEFDELHTELGQFAKECDGPIKTSFENKLLVAQNQMKGLRSRLVKFKHESNSLHETIIRIADYDLDNKGQCERERIKYSLFFPFATLFELNIIRKVAQEPAQRRMFLLGQLHASAIQEFLQEIKWAKRKPIASQYNEDPEQISFNPLAQIPLLVEE